MKKLFIIFLPILLFLCGFESNEKEARILYSKAKNMVRANQFKDAVSLFKQIIKAYNDNEISSLAQKEIDKIKIMDSPAIMEISVDARVSIDTFFICTALELYRIDNGQYPTTEQGLNILLEKSFNAIIPCEWNGPYLDADNVPNDTWGNQYRL